MKTISLFLLWALGAVYAFAPVAYGAERQFNSQPIGACDAANGGISPPAAPGGLPTFKPDAIEAETLFAAGKVSVNGGTLGVQNMSQFGRGWGGNAQLFWSGGSTGAVLEMTFSPSMPGYYDVYLHLTRAPDFGTVKTQIKSTTAYWINGASVDGWDPVVKPPPASIPLWQSFPLVKGDNHLSLMINGKNAKSSGYLVGIDCIALRFRHQ